MHGGSGMVIVYSRIVLLVLFVLHSVYAQECKITDVLKHGNGYSTVHVLHSNCDMKYSQVETGKDNQVTFFIPFAVKDEALRKSIETMNQDDSTSYYSMKINIKDNGVECVVHLNPENLYTHNTPLEVQKIKSITGKHGLVIKFHDTGALNGMLAKSGAKRIRRVAYAEVGTRPTVVVDYGHGGKDTGYYDKASGIQEKTINRQIGEKVADLLKKKIITSV